MPGPEVPDRETREKLLGVLAELVAAGGAAPLLVEPVKPGPKAFPEPWAPTPAGVALLLRRLATYAGLDRVVANVASASAANAGSANAGAASSSAANRGAASERAMIVADQRFAKAPPTERKPATRVEFLQLTRGEARFALGHVGHDDVVGTLAHEIGVAYATLHRAPVADPYRSADAPTIDVDRDVDQPRGSVATVYLGLGVVAANAAYQQYSRDGVFNGAYVPLEYDVLEAGYLPMSQLAYLVAVQSVVRDRDAPPAGLSGPQRDEVAEWIRALREDRAELCARLGVAADAATPDRAAVTAFPDAVLEPDDGEPSERKTAFRWRTHRGGVGLIAGTVLGVGIAVTLASRGMVPWIAFGGAAGGHVIGRRVNVPRCSACATIVRADATVCRRCGAALRGDIASLSERLEAEERLESD